MYLLPECGLDSEMGFLNKLFRKHSEIEENISDEKFGLLTWDEDEESWGGYYNDLKFYLSHERNTTIPSEQLKKYAFSILSDTQFLNATLQTEKNKWIADYPDAKDEIGALDFGYVSFYRYKGENNKIFAHLSPENDERLWRIEYCEWKCEGLGFDS